MLETVEHPAQIAADKVNGLLKEYSTKLSVMLEKILWARRESQEKGGFGDELDAWRDFINPLTPALHDLARHASQLIEHGGIDETTRIELRLRLAELETTLDTLHR